MGYKSYPQMSRWQHRYAGYISSHPGCCAADVNRACKANSLAGHKWVYDGIRRLIRAGVLRSERGAGGRRLLFVVE